MLHPIQQKIKNQLCFIDYQEKPQKVLNYAKHMSKSKILPRHSVSFRELSDWTDANQISAYLSEIHTQHRKDKGCFVNTVRYQSTGMIQSKERYKLSPIIMRFSNHSKVKNNKKGKEEGFKRWHFDNQNSPYQFNERSLHLLYQIKTKRQKPKQEYKEQLDMLQIPIIKYASLPKGDKLSTILKQLKRQQLMRTKKRPYNNPNYQNLDILI